MTQYLIKLTNPYIVKIFNTIYTDYSATRINKLYICNDSILDKTNESIYC